MERIPTFKEILRIAIPIMIGGVSESISAVVDTAFMGRLGTLAIDGMGMTNVFLLIIFMIGWSFSRSSQILFSQNYGAKNYKNIGAIMNNSLMILIPIGFLLFFILHYASHFLLGFIIENVKIKTIAVDICQIRAYGFPILMATMIFSSFFTGIGNTKVLIYSQGIAAISNIILNYILVFGKFGIEPLGYRGSAYATVISEILSLLVLLFYLWQNREMIQKYYLFYGHKFSLFLAREIGRLAVPMMMLHAFSLGSWIYFFSLIEKMGEKELAISLVLKQLFTAITIPGFCLGNTSSTLVGQLVGSRKVNLIIPTVFKVIKINYVILVTLAILTYIYRFPIVELFTTDQIVIQNITPPLFALLLAYLFIPSANVIFNSLSALGNTRVPLVIESLVLITYLFYLYIVITVMKSGLVLAWFSEFQYWLALLIFAIIYFWKFNWKSKIVYLDNDH